jgi:hypothetical protein
MNTGVSEAGGVARMIRRMSLAAARRLSGRETEVRPPDHQDYGNTNFVEEVDGPPNDRDAGALERRHRDPLRRRLCPLDGLRHLASSTQPDCFIS